MSLIMYRHRFDHCLNSVWVRVSALLVLLLMLGNCPSALAEVKSVQLPNAYEEFAMDPVSGDILALSSFDSQVALFREKDLKAGKTTPAVETPVGNFPCSVCFKQFGEEAYFAVACKQDTSLFLINPTDGKVAHKILLDNIGTLHVAASINPEDPFLYYCYGASHQSNLGVINLRDKKNKGVVWRGAMRCAVSADGNIVYRGELGSSPWNGSIKMSNEFTDEKPVFTNLVYEQKFPTQYVPDPFNCFVACGSSIFTRSLEKIEATVDFTPHCFFQKHPVVIGISGRPTSIPHIKPKSLSLAAASYNTFTKAGEELKLTYAEPEGRPAPGMIRRGIHAIKQRKVFADDARDRVVVAHWDQLFFVPLAMFNLPNEPVLAARLLGDSQLFVGKERLLNLQPSDDKTTIEIETLPEGMQVEGKQIRWQPAGDQVGPVKLDVTLKQGELQRNLSFDLEVRYPRLELPFLPSNWITDSEANQVLFWETQITPPGVNQSNMKRDQNATFQLALLDLKTNKFLVETELWDSVKDATLTADYALVIAGTGTPRCQILKRETLEQVKAINTSSQILQAVVYENLLLLETVTDVEVYELDTFRKISVSEKPKASPHRETLNPFTEQGILQDGMLVDAELKPLLLYNERTLFSLAGAEFNWQPAIKPLSKRVDRKYIRQPIVNSNVRKLLLGQLKLPAQQAEVTMTLSEERIPNANLVNVSLYQRELSLQLEGSQSARQVLFVEQDYNLKKQDEEEIQRELRPGQGEVLATFNQWFYRWPIPEPTETPEPRLELTMRQSAITLSGTGKTVLKHEVTGGAQPLKFSLLTPNDGISINRETGDVTIDEAAIMQQAEKAFIEKIVRSTGKGTCMDAIRAHAGQVVVRAEQILGRRPHGVPVAVPIRIELKDDGFQARKIQYFVLAELPTKPIIEILRKMDEERANASQPSPNQPMPETGEPPREPAADAEPESEVTKLRKRVDNLEKQLDLVTKQLNALLQKTEEPSK